MKREIAKLREALIDITGVLNRPQPDAALIRMADVKLERALFPLLTRVERRGPIAVGELAELSGRNYTTVSRQITTLEKLELVVRQDNESDARISEVAITAKGRAMTTAFDRAREKLVTGLLADWDKNEVTELARLLRKFADEALQFVNAEKNRRD